MSETPPPGIPSDPPPPPPQSHPPSAQSSASVPATGSADGSPDGSPSLDLAEIFGEAWQLLIRDLAPHIVATLVYTAIILLTCGVGLLVAGPLFGGQVIMALKALKGERPTYDDMWSGFRMFAPLFLLSLAMGLLTLIGLAFFVLPGIYLMIAFGFAPFLVVDRRLDVGEAMSLSMRTVNAHFLPVAFLALVLGLINTVGGSAVLGFVITQPFMILGIAVAYRRLFGLSAGPVV